MTALKERQVTEDRTLYRNYLDAQDRLRRIVDSAEHLPELENPGLCAVCETAKARVAILRLQWNALGYWRQILAQVGP